MAEASTNPVSARFPGRVRAPELRGGLGWLNTDHPLTLAELRGRIVLLDFWTYCCINCLHVLPDLHTLEARYPNALTVIGVHSAKFTEEGQTDNIRQAVLRYEIAHPVVNDAEFAIWGQYGVRAWPTLMLIDPQGYVVAGYSGEGNLDRMDDDIQSLIELFPDVAKNTPLPLTREEAPATALRYPGKVLADAAGNRLFIADSNHNQILVTDLDGQEQERIGSGAASWADGDYATAAFDHPQGMALAGDTLYVADTENHLLRAIDLATRMVTTVAGTGEQAKFRAVGGDALASALNSPWDVTMISGYVAIAMAGPHQIWLYDPDSRQVGVFAGSGAEARVDGDFAEAAFAQPSGIATDGAYLFVADSETSSIRQIDIAEQAVGTLAGEDLFEFGDVDGAGETARFQHPLGVAYGDDALYIADTYNSKIKRLDLTSGDVTTIAGTGKPGRKDGTPGTLYEPGGLSVAGNMLYIADTNNHAIRRLDLVTGALSTLSITERATEPSFPALEVVPTAPQTVATNTLVSLSVLLILPPDHHINTDAPNAQHLTIDGAAVPLPAPEVTGNALTVSLPPLAAGTHDVRYTLTLYYCREGNEAACSIRSLQWRVRVAAVEGMGIVSVPLTATLTPQA